MIPYRGLQGVEEPSLRDPSHGKPWAPPSYVAEGGHRFSTPCRSRYANNDITDP